MFSCSWTFCDFLWWLQYSRYIFRWSDWYYLTQTCQGCVFAWSAFFWRRTVYKLPMPKVQQSWRKISFLAKWSLHRKISRDQFIHVFLPSFTEIDKAEVTKWVCGIITKRLVFCPFLWASGVISPKILHDHSFPIPHLSAKFCPNLSSFQRDISENVYVCVCVSFCLFYCVLSLTIFGEIKIYILQHRREACRLLADNNSSSIIHTRMILVQLLYSNQISTNKQVISICATHNNQCSQIGIRNTHIRHKLETIVCASG